MTSDITFYRVYKNAADPMPADPAALGYIPISAFQYCEAVRVASASGWYLFPPKTISLMFDGKETFIADDGHWRAFTHESLGEDFSQHWNNHAPEQFQGHAPSYLRRFAVPGVIQIWTGYFVETREDVWLQIRPIANKYDVSSYTCFEAIVETDSFKPMPLFMNIQLKRTDCEILIEKEIPFFQVVAIEKASVNRKKYEVQELSHFERPGEFPWDGLMKTLRIDGVTQARAGIGTYASAARKASKAKL
jgi:hypothetical protein